MSIIMFAIPQDTAQWPAWLEQRIVGVHLTDLVAELKCALKDVTTEHSSLEEVCGPQMQSILRNGLRGLSTSQIRSLFKHPELLLELQDRVLTEGGIYWDNVRAPHHEQVAMDASTQNTVESLRRALTVGVSKPTVDYSSKVWSALAIAAVLLLAVGVWRNLPGKSSAGWGFEKAGLLTADVSAAKYLSNLADAAGQWSNKRPTTKGELESRLTEFRRGCGVLINAPHEQLSPNDRQWLVQKCKEWAAKLDEIILALQTGSGTVETLQGQADQTIDRLQQALRDRALQSV